MRCRHRAGTCSLARHRQARSWLAAGVLLALLGWPLSVGCGGKKRSKPKRPASAAQGAPGPHGSAAKGASTSARMVWHTPYVGRLTPLCVVGDVVIVTSRQRGDRAAARRLAGFHARDGRLLWQRPVRLRFYERGVTFSTSHAVAGGVLAVALTAGRVEGIDPSTGAKLWRLRSSSGVAAAGDFFALVREDIVLLVNPKDGAIVKQQSLEEAASGAPGNGLMDGLKKGAPVASLPGGILVTRRHGGALQALDGGTLGGRWLLPPEGTLSDRPSRLAVGASTMLVPRLQPKHLVHTELRALHAEAPEASGSAGVTRWSVKVPGRVTAKRLFVTPTQVIALTRAANRQTLLVRVDRTQGTLLDARPFPSAQFCFLVEGLLVCQREREISAIDVETLARKWRHPVTPHRTIHSVRPAGPLLVLEEGESLLAKRFTDGRSTFEVPRRLEQHPYRVVAALGEYEGRLVLAVRHLEGTPWGDRLLLLGLDVATGKTVYVHRLGRFPRPDPLRPGAVSEDEKLPGQLALLWLPPAPGRAARVMTLFEKTLQVVDAASGRPVVTRGLPGEEGKPVRLLSDDGKRALFQRGTTLFALGMPDARFLWQASLFRARLERDLPDRALLSRAAPRGRTLELAPPLAPDPLAAGRAFLEKEGCSLRHGSATLWLCQGASQLLAVDARTGKVLERLPRAAYVAWESELLLTTHPAKEKNTSPAAWIGVDLATGKERWRLEEPASATGRAPLPPPFGEEQVRPARWSAVAGSLFLVTDETGRCVHGVEQESGKPVLRQCFGALGGPPATDGREIVLTARSDAEGEGAGGKGKDLYAMDLQGRAASVVFRAPAGKSLELGQSGIAGNRLFLAVHPTKGVFSKNEIIGLELR